jgi:hypothetical protein
VSDPEPSESHPDAQTAGNAVGSAGGSAGDRATGGDTRFDERLRVPWWWWLAAAVVTGVVGHEIELSAHRSGWGYLGYVGTAIVCALALWSMGRTRIRVTADGELQAGKARLPRSVIARGATISASAKSAALGRQLDPAAFLVHHAWVKTMVLLVLDDPDDPTPYWLVSTRRPGELLEALGVPDAAATS